MVWNLLHAVHGIFNATQSLSTSSEQMYEGANELLTSSEQIYTFTPPHKPTCKMNHRKSHSGQQHTSSNQVKEWKPCHHLDNLHDCRTLLYKHYECYLCGKMDNLSKVCKSSGVKCDWGQSQPVNIIGKPRPSLNVDSTVYDMFIVGPC